MDWLRADRALNTMQAFVTQACKQLALAKRVVCCYEAVCTGYGLYQQLRGLGIE